MNARLGNVPVDGDAWPAAGLAVPDFVPTGWTDIDFTDIFAGAVSVARQDGLWVGSLDSDLHSPLS